MHVKFDKVSFKTVNAYVENITMNGKINRVVVIVELLQLATCGFGTMPVAV